MLPSLFTKTDSKPTLASSIAIQHPKKPALLEKPSCSLPSGFRWLVLAQVVGAFMALVLQLAGASVQVLAIIHVAVPLLFLTSATCSLVVLGSPGPYSSLVSAVTSALASVTAVIFLVFAVRNPHLQISAGRNVQDALFAVYIIICLSEGIMCFIIASIAYRYSRENDRMFIPVMFRFDSSLSEGATAQLTLKDAETKPKTNCDNQRQVVQLEEGKIIPPVVDDHSEC